MSDADAGRDRKPEGHRGLRRLGGALLAVAIGAALIVGLLLLLNARDEAGVHQSVDEGPAPGLPFDAASADGLLTAQQVRLLRLGDVVLLHAARSPPPALVALRDQLSGPPDPAVEAAGQAVILAPAPQAAAGAPAVTALAWGRRLETDDPADPQLEAFAEHWLGRGAGG